MNRSQEMYNQRCSEIVDGNRLLNLGLHKQSLSYHLRGTWRWEKGSVDKERKKVQNDRVIKSFPLGHTGNTNGQNKQCLRDQERTSAFHARAPTACWISHTPSEHNSFQRLGFSRSSAGDLERTRPERICRKLVCLPIKIWAPVSHHG